LKAVFFKIDRLRELAQREPRYAVFKEARAGGRAWLAPRRLVSKLGKRQQSAGVVLGAGWLTGL